MICKVLKGDSEKASPLSGFIAGGTTGSISWLLTFPTDSFKSISQTEDFDNRKYSSYRDMVAKVVKEKGFGKLYSGLGVCMLRAFPVNAITFAFYEVARTNIMSSVYKN
jgi:solute carrier family 25 (mitochondrial carnitine/acylcarnitine transporter), member 20/29